MGNPGIPHFDEFWSEMLAFVKKWKDTDVTVDREGDAIPYFYELLHEQGYRMTHRGYLLFYICIPLLFYVDSKSWNIGQLVGLQMVGFASLSLA